MTTWFLRAGAVLSVTLALSACGTVGQNGRTAFPETRSTAFYPEKTQTQRLLEQLPPPTRPVSRATTSWRL